MSNFIRREKNPATGEFEDAEWLDDYFGRHAYGVRFPSTGTVYRESDYTVLRYKPNPKSEPAKKRRRRAKKLAKGAGDAG